MISNPKREPNQTITETHRLIKRKGCRKIDEAYVEIEKKYNY